MAEHSKSAAQEFTKLENQLTKHVITGVTYLPFSEYDFCTSQGVSKLVKVDDFRTDTGRTSLGGINSLSMSAPNDLSSRLVCETCENNYENCQCHLGLIYLNGIKMYHPKFISILKSLLRWICYSHFVETGEIHLIIDEDTFNRDLKLQNNVYLKRLEGAAKYTECINCRLMGKTTPARKYIIQAQRAQAKSTQGKVTVGGGKNEKYKVIKYVEGKARVMLPEEDVYQLLRCFDELPDSIRKKYLMMMGMNQDIRLSGYIMTHVVVIPPNYRHRVIRAQASHKGSLTDDYSSIIRYLIAYQEGKSVETALKNRITNYMENTIVKNIIVGKNGVLRKDCNGTRPNFSARTVVTLSPLLKPDEIGIPEEIANNIPVRDLVTEKNRALFQGMIKKHKIKSVYRRDTPDVREVVARRDDFKLNIGDFVERPLTNGDWVLFNRQPTIHSRGVMMMRAKLVDGVAFQMSMFGTTPYHADFDGDEMNLQVPQTAAAIKQGLKTCWIGSLILDPHNGGNICGLVFELLDAAYRLTDDKTSVSREKYNRLIKDIWANDETNVAGFPSYEEMLERGEKYFDRKICNDAVIPGKLFFSSIIPKEFNHCNGNLIIINGILRSGRITKEHIGVPGSIIYSMYKDYGDNAPKITLDFLDKANRLLLMWQDTNPTTFGINDYIINIEEYVRTNKSFDKPRKEIRTVLGKIAPNPNVNADNRNWKIYLEHANEVFWPVERREMETKLNISLEKFKEMDENMYLLDQLMEFILYSSDEDLSNLSTEKKISLIDKIKLPSSKSKIKEYFDKLNREYDNFKRDIKGRTFNDAEIIMRIKECMNVYYFDTYNIECLDKINQDNIGVDCKRLFDIDLTDREIENLLITKSSFLEYLLNKGRINFNLKLAKKLQGLILAKHCESVIEDIKDIEDSKKKIIIGKINSLIMSKIINEPIMDVEEPNVYLRDTEIEEFKENVRKNIFNIIDSKEERDWIEFNRLIPATRGLNDYAKTKLDELPSSSFMRMAAKAGSKTSPDGNAKMDVYSGQQYLRARLLQPPVGERRCLVYDVNTSQPESRGFVSECLTQGVSPRGCFQFHVAGRETNIINADNTPKDGYAHRRMERVLGNSIVGNKRELISGKKRILQGIYGGDGLDPSFTANVKGKYTFIDTMSEICKINSLNDF